MKIVIEHGKTKRLIDGPFNICGTPADLREIAHQILAHEPKGYGWVRIAYEQPSIVDTPASPWDDEASTDEK